MSEGAIEPTAVYAPGESPEAIKTGRQREYETYNTREVPLGGETPPPSAGAAPPGPGGGPSSDITGSGITSRMRVRLNNLPGGVRRTRTPSGLPAILGNSSLILFAWIVTMGMVCLDEWHTYHILPRPARLWYTSITYMILALASSIDVLLPITNLFAIGFAIAVAYQYYQGTGMFGTKGGPQSGAQKNPQVANPPPPPGPAPIPNHGANTTSSRTNPAPGTPTTGGTGG